MIILTSFKNSRNLLKYSALSDAQCFSIARFQPSGFNYPELKFLAALDTDGNRLRLNGDVGMFGDYKKKLLSYYQSNKDELYEWLRSLSTDTVYMLCCWCPHSESTKGQIKEHGSFVCHTGIVGQIINKARPDIQVMMDTDRHKYLIEEYKPLRCGVME